MNMMIDLSGYEVAPVKRPTAPQYGLTQTEATKLRKMVADFLEMTTVRESLSGWNADEVKLHFHTMIPKVLSRCWLGRERRGKWDGFSSYDLFAVQEYTALTEDTSAPDVEKPFERDPHNFREIQGIESDEREDMEEALKEGMEYEERRYRERVEEAEDEEALSVEESPARAIVRGVEVVEVDHGPFIKNSSRAVVCENRVPWGEEIVVAAYEEIEAE
jgi:hypothetical protein